MARFRIDNDVCFAFWRFDPLIVHWFHRVLVLAHYWFQSTSTFFRITCDSPDYSCVTVSILEGYVDERQSRWMQRILRGSNRGMQRWIKQGGRQLSQKQTIKMGKVTRREDSLIFSSVHSFDIEQSTLKKLTTNTFISSSLHNSGLVKMRIPSTSIIRLGCTCVVTGVRLWVVKS